MDPSREPVVRISAFVVVFVGMSVWEWVVPARTATAKRSIRRTSNLVLMLLNAGLLRLVMPLSLVGVALFADRAGLGLFRYFRVSPWVLIPATVVLMDLAVYAQHVAMHKVPLLWRLHLVHHADLDIDVTTGVRFHTFEIMLSFFYKALLVIASGCPATGVLLFEVLLNATSMFSHANIRLAFRWEATVRTVVVTPDMHRVHHSIVARETNSNFGFNLSCWDRLFGTYRDQPADGHVGMTIGLPEPRDERRAGRLTQMLLLPFQSLTAPKRRV